MSDNEGGNSRSERLRRRREQRSERSEASETDKSSEPSELSKPSEPDSRDSGSESVKDEQVGTYMYIPESQKKELERLYNMLKAEYEYEYDEAFQKNRHFYPLLVKHGLDSLDGLDASELRERLDAMSD